MFVLKKKMVEDMQLHGLRESTQKVYCDAIENFSKYHNKPPEAFLQLPQLLII